MKTPTQLADEWANYMFIGDSPDAKRAIELAIKADRAQRPALEQWAIFEEEYPHDAETYNCDQETAEEIAQLTTRADQEWGCRQYIARKVETTS